MTGEPLAQVFELRRVGRGDRGVLVQSVKGTHEGSHGVVSLAKAPDVENRARTQTHLLDPDVAEVRGYCADLARPALGFPDEGRVGLRRALDDHARREKAAVALVPRTGKGGPDQLKDGVRALGPRRVDLNHRPTQDVDGDGLDTLDLAALVGDQRGPLGPGLPRVAALEITRKDDPRIGGEDLARVDVAERPVLVAMGPQRSKAAGSVRLVALATVDARVQHADIEQTSDGSRVGEGEVLGDSPRGVALAVEGNAGRLVGKRLRGLGREDVNVLGRPQVLRELALGIVVSGEEIHGDARLPELGHLRSEEEPSAVVLPVTVVEVACQNDKRNVALDGEVDEVLKRAPGRLADLVHRGALVALQSPQRAVQMNVSRVEEQGH